MRQVVPAEVNFFERVAFMDVLRQSSTVVVGQVGIDKSKSPEVRALLQESDQLVGCLRRNLAVNYPQVLQVILSERSEQDRLNLPDGLLSELIFAVDDLR